MYFVSGPIPSCTGWNEFINISFVNTQGWTKERCLEYVHESKHETKLTDGEHETICDALCLQYSLVDSKFKISIRLRDGRAPNKRMESSGKYVLETIIRTESAMVFLIVRDTNVTLRGLCIERYQSCLRCMELPEDIRESISKNE